MERKMHSSSCSPQAAQRNVRGSGGHGMRTRTRNIIRRGRSLDEDDRGDHCLAIPLARFDVEAALRRLPQESSETSLNGVYGARASHSFDNICETYKLLKYSNSNELVKTSTGEPFQTSEIVETNSSASLQLNKIPEESRRNILIEQLTQNTYECMVCYEKVLRQDPIWYCPKCHNIFHLNCIHKWAVSSLAENDDVYDGSDDTEKRWRCPGCQTHCETFPDRSWCFCGAVEYPETMAEGHLNSIPHSCGQICCRIKVDSACTHPCPIPCHPGPCPTCLIQAPRSCSCGRATFTTVCSSNNILTCENVCQKLLSCGIHRCAQGCHTKPCPKCAFSVILECHCGKDTKEVPCSIHRIHSRKFSCGKPCDKSAENPCRSLCHAGKCTRAQGGYWRRARIVPDEREREQTMLCVIFVIVLACCLGLYVLFESLQVKQQIGTGQRTQLVTKRTWP